MQTGQVSLNELLSTTVQQVQAQNQNLDVSGLEQKNQREYIHKLSFDPLKAKFQFISQKEQKQRWGYGVAKETFELNSQEKEVLKTNGFVVSERLGSYSFANTYVSLYSNDKPVFISADSILHAWHRSYDKMLEELEENVLYVMLYDILQDSIKNLSSLADQTKKKGTAEFQAAMKDVDYFLNVAFALLQLKPAPQCVFSETQSRVKKTLSHVDSLQMQEVMLFNKKEMIDFSQFKVRGHYENSKTLQRYFQSMIWLGRTDLKIAGGNTQASSPEQLLIALILSYLISGGNKNIYQRWEQFDDVITVFVGKTDSMNFKDMKSLVENKVIPEQTAEQLSMYTISSLAELQKQILSTAFGEQMIVSHVFTNKGEKVKLPRSFTFLGQKFAIDSWAMTKLVYDEVPFHRRIPSGLDVAYTVFDNTHALSTIADRIQGKNEKVPFRDGIQYQSYLVATNAACNATPAPLWDSSIYFMWLKTLKELSKPCPKSAPEVFHTKAWASHDINTQLASWTQLRHDSILYVKQGYTIVCGCDYPYAMVDPRVSFWRSFQQMAQKSSALLGKLKLPTIDVPMEEKPQSSLFNFFGASSRNQQKPTSMGSIILHKQANFLMNFANTVGSIAELAEQQAKKLPYTTEQTKFVKDLIEKHMIGSGGEFSFSGWYCRLFYSSTMDADSWDPLVADVHTDVPCPEVGDPGGVLHQGVGNVHLMLVACEQRDNQGNIKDVILYGSPVLSYYEFATQGVQRVSDSEWRAQLKAYKQPPHPEFTKSFLVPGKNGNVQNYRHEKDNNSY